LTRQTSSKSGDINPEFCQALFKIPKSPPPAVENPSEFSDEFNDFISKCCVKAFADRSRAAALLEVRIYFSAVSLEYFLNIKINLPNLLFFFQSIHSLFMAELKDRRFSL
jgi:serine/threonine protein kinase